MIANFCFRFGKRSLGEVNKYMHEFVLTPEVLAKITCPTLAMIGKSEGNEPAHQAEEFCSLVSGPVSKRVFTDEEGAGSHLQAGNYRLAAGVMLDWINDVFGNQHVSGKAKAGSECKETVKTT